MSHGDGNNKEVNVETWPPTRDGNDHSSDETVHLLGSDCPDNTAGFGPKNGPLWDGTPENMHEDDLLKEKSINSWKLLFNSMRVPVVAGVSIMLQFVKFDSPYGIALVLLVLLILPIVIVEYEQRRVMYYELLRVQVVMTFEEIAWYCQFHIYWLALLCILMILLPIIRGKDILGDEMSQYFTLVGNVFVIFFTTKELMEFYNTLLPLNAIVRSQDGESRVRAGWTDLVVITEESFRDYCLDRQRRTYHGLQWYQNENPNWNKEGFEDFKIWAHKRLKPRISRGDILSYCQTWRIAEALKLKGEEGGSLKEWLENNPDICEQLKIRNILEDYEERERSNAYQGPPHVNCLRNWWDNQTWAGQFISGQIVWSCCNWACFSWKSFPLETHQGINLTRVAGITEEHYTNVAKGLQPEDVADKDSDLEAKMEDAEKTQQ